MSAVSFRFLQSTRRRESRRCTFLLFVFDRSFIDVDARTTHVKLITYGTMGSLKTQNLSRTLSKFLDRTAAALRAWAAHRHDTHAVSAFHANRMSFTRTRCVARAPLSPDKMPDAQHSTCTTHANPCPSPHACCISRMPQRNPQDQLTPTYSNPDWPQWRIHLEPPPSTTTTNINARTPAIPSHHRASLVPNLYALSSTRFAYHASGSPPRASSISSSLSASAISSIARRAEMRIGDAAGATDVPPAAPSAGPSDGLGARGGLLTVGLTAMTFGRRLAAGELLDALPQVLVLANVYVRWVGGLIMRAGPGGRVAMVSTGGERPRMSSTSHTCAQG